MLHTDLGPSSHPSLGAPRLPPWPRSPFSPLSHRLVSACGGHLIPGDPPGCDPPLPPPSRDLSAAAIFLPTPQDLTVPDFWGLQALPSFPSWFQELGAKCNLSAGRSRAGGLRQAPVPGPLGGWSPRPLSRAEETQCSVQTAETMDRQNTLRQDTWSCSRETFWTK